MRRMILAILLGILLFLAWVLPPVFASLTAGAIFIFTTIYIEIALKDRDRTDDIAATLRAVRHEQIVTQSTVASLDMKSQKFSKNIADLDDAVEKLGGWKRP